MAEQPDRKKRRITPRNSFAAPGSVELETPNAQLRQLASISKHTQTPAQRTPRYISLQTPGSRALNSARRTPTSTITTRTPITHANIRNQRPSKQGPPTTPHAIRALQQRRNATPGRQYDNRRKSGLQQRDTPQNDLRALGKALARHEAPSRIKEEEQEEQADRRPRLSAAIREVEEPLEPAPRLSIPLHDREDDSWNFSAAPRVSAIDEVYDDEDLTVKSVEAGRRALLDDRRRLSQETIRALRQAGVDEDEDELTAELGDLIEDPTLAIYEDEAERGYEVELESGDETGELRAMLHRNRRSSRPSGGFDMGASPDTDGEPTFVFRIPEQRRRSTLVLPPTTDLSTVQVEGMDEANASLPMISVEDDGVTHDDDGQQDRNEVRDMPESDSETSEEFDAARLQQSSRLQSNFKGPEPVIGNRSQGTPEAQGLPKSKRGLVSMHGIKYTPFPMSVIKKITSTFMRTHGGGKAKIDKDTLVELNHATDWFFEQVSEDLAAYAGHAKRKTIEESDVVMLMKRQNQITPHMTPFALASKLLPRELLKEISVTAARPRKMVKTSSIKRRR